MTLLSKLNAKYGRYGVPNVTIALIGGQALLYVAAHLNLDQNGINLLERIQLDPQKVMAGEVWRLVTFLFDPPAMNVIFAFFFWYLFYLMGTTLESIWGAFRYNVFLGIGYVATVAFALATYVAFGGAAGTTASNLFLQGTVFLAFARLYPDFTLLIMFVLPVKIRWLAMFQWIIYGFTFIMGPTWMNRAMVVAAVANYLLFFGRDIWRDMKQGHRRMKLQAQSLKSPKRLVHKCRVCGITSEQAPQLQFRYCSKCDGENCYCQEHLRDHEHVVAQVTTSGAANGTAN